MLDKAEMGITHETPDQAQPAVLATPVSVLRSGKSKVGEELGNLLYHIHSTHWSSLIGHQETTSLQFYEHVVVATISKQLWCFPKKYTVEIIPRFKIVNTAFSLGPRSIPKTACLFMLIGITLTIVGIVAGGCTKCQGSSSSSYTDDYSSSYYSSYSSYNEDCGNSGTCASLVIGILLLLVPFLVAVGVPLCCKWHYIYLDVKNPAAKVFNFGGVTSYGFRFRKIGFDHKTDDKASFDEFYLVEYVFGSLARAGSVVTQEAHMLSHFNHAALSTPIVPIHADNIIGQLTQRKNGNGDSVIAGMVKRSQTREDVKESVEV